MRPFDEHQRTMRDFARLLGLVSIHASAVLACAPKAERPPFTDTDQEGRTPTRVTPGASRADAGETSSGDTSADGSTGSDGDSADTSTGPAGTVSDTSSDSNVPLPEGFTRLEEWTQAPDWSGLKRMIAASSAGEVYVSDGRIVYKVVGGEVTVFTEFAELGYEADYTLAGLAVEAVGKVHVFVQPDGQPAVDHVLDAQGNAVDVMAFANTTVSYATVSPQGDIFFVDSEGVKRGTTGGGNLIAGVDDLGGAAATGCDAEALTVGAERFYYLPGCEGSAIYFGVHDGSYNRLLVEINDVLGGVEHIVGENHYYGFEGIAAHPLGGVVLNFEQLLMRIHDNGSWELYSTEPWLGHALPSGSPFHSSPVAIDLVNAYLLAGDDVWKIEGVFEP